MSEVQASPFGRVEDVSSVGAMLDVVKKLIKAGKAQPLRKDNPQPGALLFWTGHIAIVVEVKTEGEHVWLVFAHMGRHGARELGKSNATYWLKM